jgi:hypothetical protein
MGESQCISINLCTHCSDHSDTFDIIQHPPLLPPVHTIPGTYDPVETRTLDRDSTVADICDFVVEYIRSDVLVRFSCGI